MNVFVAGATGVLGRRVVRRLLDHGHHVVGLSRSDANATRLSLLGAEARSANLFDAASVLRATEGCDAILHLATSIPTNFPSKLADWQMNDRLRVEGTRNLIAAALAHHCELYVQQSIMQVYGDHRGAWIDESTPLATKLGGVLESALTMEHLVHDAIEQQHLPAITLRFGNFYGPEAAHTRALFELIERGRFPILGDGETWWNMLHLDDAAYAVVAAVDNQSTHHGQAFNIVDGSPIHMREYIEGVAELLDARKPRHLSLWLAKLTIGQALVQPLLISNRTNHDKATWGLGWTPRYPDFRFGHQSTLHVMRGELVGAP